MTQDNKNILFKDLCARLPYKTKIQLTEYSDLTGEKLPNKIKILDYCMLGRVQAYCNGFRKDEIKPYLFPLSSMTEEQKKEYAHILVMSSNLAYCQILGMTVEDWFNKNHFDYRGLIPMGLANDATGLGIYE